MFGRSLKKTLIVLFVLLVTSLPFSFIANANWVSYTGSLTLSCDGDAVVATWQISAIEPNSTSFTINTLMGRNYAMAGNYAAYITDDADYEFYIGAGSGQTRTPFSKTSVTLSMYDYNDNLISSASITCPSGSSPAAINDGRINNQHFDKVAIYPLKDEDGTGFQVWLTQGLVIPQLELTFSAEDLAKLPAKPSENMLIGEALGGLIQVFKLTTGEYQVNYGPDAEGKIVSFIFSSMKPGDYTTA